MNLIKKSIKTDKLIKKIIKNNTKINIKIKNETYIKKINKKYRKKNKTTDILTFKNEITNNKKSIDIILCKKVIKKKHKSNWKKILIHGLLHALNYRHKTLKENKIMENLQKKIGMSGFEPPTITTSK